MARTRYARFAGWALIWALVAGILSGNAGAALPQFEQPDWAALTPAQRAILAPLEKEWGKMDAFRRKKWIGIAQRYPEMSPSEQASMQRNMREWARLAPEERKLARAKYKSFLRIDPEQRRVVKQKWEEYVALSEEEKAWLRNRAPRQVKIKTPTRPPAAATTATAATAAGQRIATPPVAPAPNSPLSPLKPPQNPLAPNATEPLLATPRETSPGGTAEPADLSPSGGG